MENITYDVRIHGIEPRKNTAGVITSHRLSWKVAGEVQKRTFSTHPLADAFRSELMTASKRGEAFSLETGLPISWQRKAEEEDTPPSPSWYAFAVSYVDSKWSYVSANHRRGIAEALTDATEVLLIDVDKAAPSREEIRAALRWAYSDRARDPDAPPPAGLVEMVTWLDQHTVPMRAFEDPKEAARLARAVLDRISRKKNGKIAAANTANRKRMTLNNAMGYAQEITPLIGNPLKAVKWTKPRLLTTVDPRVVISVEQARRFLSAVHKHSQRGERMKAFFGCMYFAALRPEEVIDLHRAHLTRLPAEPGTWGEMRLTGASPRPGSRWTDNGRPRERRELKHRAKGDTRTVPIHPELVALLRWHLETFGTGPEGRVFIGPRGGEMTDRSYLKVFHEARAAAFTPEEAASPLMDVPYALRHAAVSTWLNAAVPAPQVAEWAGHSVDVLLKVYAKCIHGQQNEAMRRIWTATQP